MQNITTILVTEWSSRDTLDTKSRLNSRASLTPRTRIRTDDATIQVDNGDRKRLPQPEFRGERKYLSPRQAIIGCDARTGFTFFIFHMQRMESPSAPVRPSDAN